MKAVDFMVSVRDFFAVLVPGAVLLWLLLPAGNGDHQLDFGVLAFAVAAYLAGSVASGIGAAADHLIDRVLTSARFAAFKRGGELRSLERAADVLRDEALVALDEFVTPNPTPETLTLARAWSARSFWWMQIRIHCPPGLAELDRVEANQKLFRSLIVVFAFLAMAAGLGFTTGADLPGRLQPHLGWIWLGLALGSLVPYAIGRYHFARAVYELAATLNLQRPIEAGQGAEGSR